MAAIDGMDCTYREGGQTRHCRIERPCLRCRAERAESAINEGALEAANAIEFLRVQRDADGDWEWFLESEMKW
jgi:hypothetical protein